MKIRIDYAMESYDGVVEIDDEVEPVLECGCDGMMFYIRYPDKSVFYSLATINRITVHHTKDEVDEV